MMYIGMKTHVTRTSLEGLVLVNIDYFKDERGFFIESWNKKSFAEAGISDDFVQDSHSGSGYGVLRGMHYQDMSAPTAKLVRCTVGRIFDVAVDLRMSSPTFGKWFSVELSSENKSLLYVPVGFAHGFVVLSEAAEVQYKTTDYYAPAHERTLLWNDPALAIPWPLGGEPILAEKDRRGVPLSSAERFA